MNEEFLNEKRLETADMMPPEALIRNPRKIRTWLNYDAGDMHRDGEVNNKPSETVPNQAMDIREIFKRYAQGLPLGMGHNGMQFTGEEDIDISRMDKTEVAQFRLDLQNRIEELKGNLQSQRTDRYKKLVEEEERRKELEESEAQMKELTARLKKLEKEEKVPPEVSKKDDNKS